MIMKTFQAIEKMKYLQPVPLFICHSRVVELHPEETAAVVAYNEKIHQGVRPGQRLMTAKSELREYKCLDCGRTWQEDIHAPLIVTSSQMQTCYPQAKPCSVLK